MPRTVDILFVDRWDSELTAALHSDMMAKYPLEVLTLDKDIKRHFATLPTSSLEDSLEPT